MGKKRTKTGKPRKRVQGEDNKPLPDQAEILNNELDKELEFEDPFEDEFEEEDVIDEVNDDPVDDEEVEDEGEVWDSRKHGPLQDDEVLEYDSTAYDMLHHLSMEWSCLSFDFIRDELGPRRKRFPHTMYAVAGTQAGKEARGANKLMVVKLSDLHKTRPHDESDSDEESEDGDPILEFRSFNHRGGINRVKSMPQQPQIVASWSENSKVYVWDCASLLQSLDGHGPSLAKEPVATLAQHKDEGFALAWSPLHPGRLASGDCSSGLRVWDAVHMDAGAYAWKHSAPFTGHGASVEDIQWSPSEDLVFVSASADKTLKVWDIRSPANPGLTIPAHESDVNVVSWNTFVSYLMVSGSDDGSFRIWDLRRHSQPVANYQYHDRAITSLEWSPHEESGLIVSSEDNTVTIWDFSVEEDTEGTSSGVDVPPQLMFVHMGQTEIKEVHWHPQIPGAAMSTALDGFNVFKPSNIGAIEDVAGPEDK